MIMRAAIFLAIGLMLAGPASAMQPDDTAGYLCDTCLGSTEDQIFCLGYIRGIITAYDGEAEQKITVPVYCLPPGTPLNDIKEIWDRYCGNHPKDRDARASSLLAVALARAYPYPCPAVSPKPPAH
jgi:hypothetical protein